MQKVSLGLVFVALLVTAPRLTLAFILGDGIEIPQHIEVGLLTATGIGSGIVLTVGNAILAHALAEKSKQKGLLWWVLLLAWTSFLCSAIIVVSPTLVAGLRKSSLVTVMPSSGAQWFWAITAVAVVEVLVGASTMASILENESDAPRPASEGAFGRIGSALLRRIEQSIAAESPKPSRGGEDSAEANGVVSLDHQAITSSQKKQQRQQEIITSLLDGDELDIAAAADKYSVTQQTIYRDIKEIQDKMAQAG